MMNRSLASETDHSHAETVNSVRFETDDHVILPVKKTKRRRSGKWRPNTTVKRIILSDKVSSFDDYSRVDGESRFESLNFDESVDSVNGEGEPFYETLKSVNMPTTSGYLAPQPERIPEFIFQGHQMEERPDNIRNRKNVVQRTVYTKVVFLKLGEIRTLHEDFHADLFIQFKWREKKLDRRTWTDDFELENVNEYWRPNAIIENSLGDLRETVNYIVTYCKNGAAFICEKRRVKGTFSESMELARFPFDTQNLTVSLTSSRTEDEVVFKKDPDDQLDLALQMFVDQQEWTLHKETEVVSDVTTLVTKNQTYRRPKLNVSLKATRKASYFVFNIVLYMIFICSLIFATFAVDYSLVQNRLQLAFILLLSNVTFKRTVSDSLPKVSYMTYLDYYIVIQTAVMFFVSVWHAIVYQIDDDAKAHLADKIALIIFGSVYFLEHVVFFCLWLAIHIKQKQWPLLKKFV